MTAYGVKDATTGNYVFTWRDRVINHDADNTRRIAERALVESRAAARLIYSLLTSRRPTTRWAMQVDPEHRDSLDRFFAWNGTLTQDSTDGQEARSQARQDDRQACATQA